MKHYFKSNKFLLFLYIIFAPIGIICSLTFVFIFQSIIDIATSGTIDDLKNIISTAILVMLLDMMVALFIRYLKRIIVRDAIIKLKEDSMDSILKLSLSDFSAVNTSNQISLLNNDIRMIEQGYFMNILSLYQQTINLVIYTIAALMIQPLVAVLILTGALTALHIPTLFSKRLGALQVNYSIELGNYTSKVKDFLTGFQIIKTYNIEQPILQAHKEANSNLEICKTVAETYNYNVSWLSGSITQLMYMLIMLIGTYFVLKGELTVGLIIALLELIGGIVAPVELISAELTQLKSTAPITKKFIELIKPVKTTKILKNPTEVKTLSINNVSFGYTDSTPVLKNIELKFELGKKYAIVGASGSGKSTLINLLLGLYTDYTGEILVDDIRLSNVSKQVLYNNVVVISQDIFIFDDTLKNNICLYMNYPPVELEQVLKLTKLEELVKKLPNGLDTILREDGNILSGGEKQRIAIARAVLKNSNFLILDESTSSLDNNTAYAIEENILSLEHKSCIAIMHKLNPRILDKFDEIIVLKDGEIKEKGSFEKLLDSKGYFVELYQT
ncbi:MAG: hypothetical protein ATN35_06000 [Epulopiscium sp. Nele67-Bin004]|nr:MAG: hypothetical protein ATN35_06000 [Epulopiscium sp. Nele67-Bin004]